MKRTNSKIVLLVLLTLAILLLVSCNPLCLHDECRWQLVRDATIEARGERQYVCSDCCEVIKTEQIPRLELSPDNVKKQIAPAVFKVYGLDYDNKSVFSQGSGFFIDGEGTFLTNAHVVNESCFVKIELSDGKIYNVDKIYAYDYESSDIAVCHAEIEGNSYVKFSEDVMEGDTVYALGYPNNADNLQVSSGEILSTDTRTDGVKYYATDTFINNGSSGGVLANAQGEVIGITTCLFDNKQYGSLRYTDFKDKLLDEYQSAVSPAEMFRNATRLPINDENVYDYIEIISELKPSLIGNKLNMIIVLTIPEKYKSGGITIASDSLDLKVKLTVDLSYTGLSGKPEEKRLESSRSITVYGIQDFISGIDISAPIDPNVVSISNIAYEYKIELVNVSGDVFLFEKG